MKVIQSNSRFSQIMKPLLQKILFYKKNKSKLLILGCQRSGTTLLTRLFDDLLGCSVYGEFSILSEHGQDRIRMQPLSYAKSILDKDKAPLIVMKPLVESQQASLLLETFEHSKILWVFRNPLDVALSMVKKFPLDVGGYRGLQAFMQETEKNDNWRSEGASSLTISMCRKYYSEGMRPLDAALLFWYARNNLFFEQELEKNPRCMMFCYDSFLDDPLPHYNKVLNFVNFKPIRKCRAVEKQNKRNHSVEYDEEIMTLCTELHQNMLSVFRLQ